MALAFLRPSEFRVVILSRGRSDTITSHKLLPFATLVVPKAEAPLYEHTGLEIVTTPDDVRGLGPLRNWVLDRFAEEIIVMADDDISYVWVTCKKNGYKITDPQAVLSIIESAALCARDLGTACFGFHQAWDVRKYDASRPFRLNGWVGGVIGVVGRENRFSDSWFKVDVDFCLQTLLKQRVLWIDNRFSFVQVRDKNRGGNALFRTEAAVRAEVRKLKNKWGRHFEYRETKAGSVTRVHVPRQQALGV